MSIMWTKLIIRRLLYQSLPPLDHIQVAPRKKRGKAGMKAGEAQRDLAPPNDLMKANIPVQAADFRGQGY